MVVREARDGREVEEALRLRDRVFVGEQGVSPEADRDGRDGEAIHIVAIDGTVVGTCRLLMRGEVARLGRMAVDRSARGRGIGRAVLEEAEQSARRAGAHRVKLHAQIAVKDLYARSGYVPYGQRFIEEGIEHVGMEKQLA